MIKAKPEIVILDAQTRLASVHLTVTDLGRSLDFYQRALGFKLHGRQDDTAHLGAGKEDLLRLTARPDAVRVRHTTGLYHFAILVPSRRELAHSLQRIAETQTRVQGFADHLVSEAIYLADPDGNGIEIYRDRPRDQWQREPDGRLKMATDPLDVDGVLAELAGRDESWSGLHPDTRLGHMHLHVSHLAEAERFYHKVLGFDLVTRYGPSAAFLSAGGYHHHIGLNTWAGVGAPPPPTDAVGLRHFEIQLSSEKELDRLIGRLQAAALSFESLPAGLLVHDPSENSIAITVATTQAV